MRILVTGATGNTGVSAVKTLSAAGHEVVAVSRDPTGTVGKLLSELKGVEVTTLDNAFDKPLDRAFICTAVSGDIFSRESDVYNRCKNAGVKYIVKISTYEPIMTFYSPSFYGRSHIALEYFLEHGDIPFTSIRPPIFFPYLGVNINQLKNEKEKSFKSVLGDYEVKAIDPADIGVIAASLLSLNDPSPHFGKKYQLDGPELLTGERVRAAVSELLNEKVTFTLKSYDELLEELKGVGYKDYEYKGIAATIIALQNEDLKNATATDLALLPFTKKTTFKQYLAKQL